MTALKTNEKPGTRAVLSSYRASAYKFREVLNLIRGRDVKTAKEILAGLERDVAGVVSKLLDSAIANAVNNDHISADELYVASCYADEGPTMRRFRARARGRAGALRKRTSHVTVIVARMEEDQLKVIRSKRDAEEAKRRARRVARTRGSAASRKAEEEKQPEVVEAAFGEQETAVAESVAEAPMATEESVEAEAVAAEPVENEAAAAGEGISEEAAEVSDAVDESSESTESEEEEK